MLSRIENILQSIVDSSEYDGPVQSRIEQLLLDIKSVISTGGSGGVTEATVSTMITTAINSLIDTAPDEYNTLGKIAAKLLLTDEQIQTITEALSDKVDKVPDKGLSTNDFTTALKTKLEGIAEGATKTIVDAELSTTSTNVIQNKAVGLKFKGIDSELATNLIDTSKIPSTTAYGITRTVYADGKIVFNGTNTLSNDFFLVLMASRPLTAGNYRFTPNGTAISGTVPDVYQLYKDGKYFKGIRLANVLTIDTDAKYGIGAIIKPGGTINTAFYPMLESGSDAHNYVQYTGDTGTLNGDLAALASKFNDPGLASISPGSDVASGSISYKQSNLIINIIGKNIKVLNAAKTVSIGTIESSQCPQVDTKVPTNIANVFANISTSGTISLEHTTGVLSTSDSYTFSATYLT